MKNTDNSIYQLNLDHSQSTDKCQEILEKIAAEKNITVEIKQIDFRNRITLEFKNNADIWSTINNWEGISTSQPESFTPDFTFYSIAISEDYLYDGFQFTYFCMAEF